MGGPIGVVALVTPRVRAGVRYRATALALPVLLAFVLGTGVPATAEAQRPVPAQGAEQGDARGAGPLSLLGTAEAESLRRIVATPAPADAGVAELRRHFVAATDAASRLGDSVSRKRLLQEAVQRLPDDPRWPNDLAAMLRLERAWDESRRLFEMAVERAREPTARVFYETNLVYLLVDRGAADAAERLAAARARATELASPSLAPQGRLLLLRAQHGLASAETLLNARRGLLHDQLRSAVSAERTAAEALDLVKSTPALQGSLRACAESLASAQKDHAAALRQLDRDADAEALLHAHVRFIREHTVGGAYAAGAHAALAALAADRREFAASEREVQLSLQVLDRLGMPADAPTRSDRTADLAMLRWVQGRAAEGAALLEAHDRELGTVAAARRSRHATARGVILLTVGRAGAAVPLLADAARARRRESGAGHHRTALAEGLEGAARWATGDPAEQERGTELLRRAVADLHAPRNADALTQRGWQPELRAIVHRAYLDAMTTRGGLAALWAFGVADHLRGGLTAQAMADAALRAAAADPDLAALVRQEQDARRELQAAEAALQGGAGTDPGAAGAAPPPASLRQRVSELDALRAQLQHRIRERFPAYDRIVRPPLPDPATLAQRLDRGEAFVMLVPAERHLLAWVISADDLPHFARLDVDAATLRALVSRVRAGLDVSGGRVLPFDRAAARELYRRVLAPLEPRLATQRQLVIAAAGPLAVLPFAVLEADGGEPQAPAWLPRRWALAQVPSAASWLALRELPRAQPAPQAMLAWGDPLFAAAPVAPGGPVRTNPARATRGAGNAPRYEDLPPLPETRDELLAIAAALKADPARDLRLGAAATRDSLLEASRSGELARRRVIVLATHGLMAGDLPGLTQPALALARAPGSLADVFARSLLTLDDVLTLRLNADWVVLSACNTAAGDGQAEEALSGLARGFFYAGSRSVLVTQWAVETVSAQRLTTALFEHQARNPASGKAESLRQAMLAVMAEPRFAHPVFWAPYMLVGDGAR